MSKKTIDDGGELSTIPNDKYKKFFAKFNEIDTLDVKDWKVAHLLGYFCKKYKEAYDVEYSWKFNNPSPTKCFEVWQANTLAAKLSANPKILRDYIDWVFEKHVVKAKRRLTSISFMTHDNVVIDYKMNVLLANKKDLHIDRSTALPKDYQAVFGQAGTVIHTYGELAFVSQMDPMPEALGAAFNKIQEMGFDPEILRRIV
jgi:hypothetical protein